MREVLLHHVFLPRNLGKIARKENMECKYWLYPDSFDIAEAYAYNLTPSSRREIRKIIFAHFDYIVAEYESYQQRGMG